ncbi:hypothetical protein GGI05_003045 [Coemansia sp. RSA 2603]|nr:hypothetical protein GGI05_003045 [Coemansia sp. RSA 2603]
MRSICTYPSVVFRGRSESKDRSAARDNSVIWEIPRDHFQSISHSVCMSNIHSIKKEPVRVKSIAGLSLVSGARSQLTTGPTWNNESYMAYMHGQAPLLNPSYGWGPSALSQPMHTSVTVN